MEENRFDQFVKSVMDGGREEVPAGIWDAVQQQIPSSDKRRKAAIIWFSGAAAAVAAAAVTLAVVLPGREGGVEMLTDQEKVLTDVPEPAETQSIPAVENDPAVAEMTARYEDLLRNARPSAVSSVWTDNTSGQTSTGDADNKIEDGRNVSAGNESAGNESAASTDVTVPSENSPAPVTPSVPAAKDSTVTATEVVDVTEGFNGHFEKYVQQGYKKSRPVRLSLSGEGSNGQFGSKTSLVPTSSGRLKAPKAPPQTTTLEETGESSYSLPFSAGLGIKIPLSDRWAIGTGVNYTWMSRSTAGTYTLFDGDVFLNRSSFTDIKNGQSYIGIPLDIYFNIVSSKTVDFYVYAGGTVEKCVSNKFRMASPEKTYTYSKPVKGVQTSVGAGIGVEFNVTDHLGVYLDPSARYFFNTDNAKNVRSAQPFTMGVELGLRFKL